jgi:predicted amino acid dehydrogenase
MAKKPYIPKRMAAQIKAQQNRVIEAREELEKQHSPNSQRARVRGGI